MAQKTLEQGAVRTGQGKSPKALPPVESVVAAETVVKVSQTARQEYPEVNAAIDRGLADVAAGRVHRMSFAEYAEAADEN